MTPPQPGLELLARFTVELGGPVWELGETSDLGNRRIVPITGGHVVRPRLAGEILDDGADWQVVTRDGATLIDTRYLLRLDDGADADGQVLPAGAFGEIQVRGRNVIEGYWNRPEASADVFADGGWFRSGDLGYLDEDGFLFISDRLKDMIISGGENIYPAEIERVILELEAVQSVAVVGAPDDRWGEVPHAYLEIRPGHTLADDAVQRHLAGRLARYKIPKRVIVVDELPRTA
jgi:acyl-CoA synthetase (AMP-forming)/AMP-acid ligase II